MKWNGPTGEWCNLTYISFPSGSSSKLLSSCIGCFRENAVCSSILVVVFFVYNLLINHWGTCSNSIVWWIFVFQDILFFEVVFFLLFCIIKIGCIFLCRMHNTSSPILLYAKFLPKMILTLWGMCFVILHQYDILFICASLVFVCFKDFSAFWVSSELFDGLTRGDYS